MAAIQQRAVSQANELARLMFTEWITSQIDGDDATDRQGGARLSGHRQAHPAGQRQLAGTLRRDNVDLVRCGIDHIEPDAVVTPRVCGIRPTSWCTPLDFGSTTSLSSMQRDRA